LRGTTWPITTQRILKVRTTIGLAISMIVWGCNRAVILAVVAILIIIIVVISRRVDKVVFLVGGKVVEVDWVI
jgi:hypothetical protein